jgi:hypothetical protein
MYNVDAGTVPYTHLLTMYRVQETLGEMNRALYQTLDRRTFMDRLVIQVYPSHFHSLSFSFMTKIEHNNAVWEHVNYC